MESKFTSFLVVFYSLFFCGLQVLQIFLIKSLVDFLEKNDSKEIKEKILTALGILGGLLFLSFLKPIALNFTDFQFWRASNKIQISLYGMILSKSTRYNTLNASLHPSGRILNYVQVDVPKYEMYFPTLY